MSPYDARMSSKKPSKGTKKLATKKAAARKKPAAQKPAARKPATKKPAAKKPAAKKPAASRKRALVKSGASPKAAVLETDRTFAPFVLLSPSEHSDSWTLLLADAYSPADTFEEQGHSGNGYSWDSVARVALRDFPEHVATIEFDSEAGTFVAMSEDKASLVALGGALKRLLDDEEALRTAIRAVPEDDWDD